MKISAIVLTRNEENKIQKCLKALSFADEIIIIDNVSTDSTIELARKFNSRIFSYKGTDFSHARSLGKKEAKFDWLLYIDADEIVSQELALEIKTAKTGDYGAYSINRQNNFYGKIWPENEKIIRLINKNNLIGWEGAVHETPIIIGKIGLLKKPLLHFTHDDISKMVDKTNLWSDVEADLRFKTNHPPVVLWRFIRVMLTSFMKSYITEKAFKKGTFGFIESIYQSYSIFITYAKLWERQNRVKKS